MASIPAPGTIPPVASVALFSLPRVLVRATAHRLSVLYREGTINSFSLSNDNKSTITALLSLPFRSTDRPNCSSISFAEVNCCQTFTAVDNTTVFLTSGKDLRPSQELDLTGGMIVRSNRIVEFGSSRTVCSFLQIHCHWFKISVLS
ncbi:hypothetical protein B296_00058292 [Ensete ventricosum]|uniref:Uncharacterized protein n=1 Tax=Ensete ventricosum TaxID=4639 RepID=A0A426X2H9_ENSVE|nr:hypothetical protein B296_00058292 [Ensete ventricosum]